MKPGGRTPASITNEGKKNPNIICFTCKEKGHISSNCPKKGTTTESGGKGGGGKGVGKDKNQVTNPYKMKPKDGESLVKTINGQECTWCDKFRQWTSGEKQHTTEEHKPRSELQGGGTPSTPVSNLASSRLGKGLIMMHFHGAGHA